jgi:arylsulfatase
VAGRPRNLLFIWTDEQRPDTIGAYGNPYIRTPNLDRLAARSVLFEQAYCAQPVCSPSRATVVTGVYPHTHGLLRNNMVLTPGLPTLAELLRPAGYVCGYVGKWHLGNEVRPQRGFEQFWVSTEDNYTRDYAAEGFSSYHQFLVQRGYTPPDERHGYRIFSRSTAARLPEEVGKPAFQARECIRFLETYHEQPFFLMVNFLEPHMPFFGPFDGMYRAEDMSLSESWYREMEPTVPLHYRLLREFYARQNRHVKTNDEWGWKELKARYWGLCSLVDKHAGRILQRLEELGLAEDTIVVYTSDHGDMMGDHRLVAKCVQYEGAVRVPLLIRVPGLPPRRIITPVSLVDLVPTLLELLGLPLPEHLQGRSLVPLLTHGDVAPDDAEVVIEWNGWDGFDHIREQLLAERTGLDEQPLSLDARTIRRGRWKLTLHMTGEHELYNLQADPGEMHNAFHDPACAPVVRTLYERLLAWQRRTNDPLVLPEPA